MNRLSPDSLVSRHSLSRAGKTRLARLRHTMAGLFLTASIVAGNASEIHEPIVGYDLTGSTSSSEPAATVAPGVTGLDLTMGPGLGLGGLANGFAANGWNKANPNPNRQAAIDNGDFFQFGFTVGTGDRAHLSTLDATFRRSALAAPMHLEFQYSLDGFATPGVSIHPAGEAWDEIEWIPNSSVMHGADTIEWTGDSFLYRGRNGGAVDRADVIDFNYITRDVTLQDGGNPIPTIDLTGIAELQGVPEGVTVTFRLYAWSNPSFLPTATNQLALGKFNGPVVRGVIAPAGQTPLTIVSSQPGVDPAPGVYLFTEGSELNLSVPDEVSGPPGIRDLLTGWTGWGSAPASGSGNSVGVTLNNAAILRWDWDRQHRLAAGAQGDGSTEVRATTRIPLLAFNFGAYTRDFHQQDGVPASLVSEKVETSTITRGSGLVPEHLAPGGMSVKGWNFTPTLTDAIFGDKYLDFNVTPAFGESIDLTAIYIPYRYTQTAAHSIALLYSFDNFATYTEAESRVIQDQSSGTQIDSHLFDLSDDPALKDVTSNVQFRIYGWGGTSADGTFALRNERGVHQHDMFVFGGIIDVSSIAGPGNEDFWFSVTDTIDARLEASASTGSMFTGWSGDFYSNVPVLAGLTMKRPVSAQANFSTDSNGDGIPDWWKLQHFGTLSVNAGDDPDEDGFTNLEEYQLGTDPTVAEELMATDNLTVSAWENVQRDPLLPGQFIIRDFGDGFRGAWENSNNNRSALTPFHPDGELVTPVNNVSYDGPRMIVREEAWDDSWSNPAVSTVFSVGDDDGTSLFFNYQDELNWYRVTVSAQVDGVGNTRPRFGVNIDKRVNGQYSQLAYDPNFASDPEDDLWFKRVRVTAEPQGDGWLVISLAGWSDSIPAWGADWDIWVWDMDLEGGRAGIGAWAQGNHSHTLPPWNPVDNGVLFESFTVTVGGNEVFHEDWSTLPEAGIPAGWQNPFDGNTELDGNWRSSAHGTLAQMSSQGGDTSGTETFPKADADGPILLGPVANVSSYLMEFGIHAFRTGGAGFVFDYKDTANYGRVLFVNNPNSPDESIPSGVVVSRKTNGAWTDIFLEDQTFVRREARPFQVSFARTGDRYVMSVRELDDPEPAHRWEWEDAGATSGSGRYGFATWRATNVHFLYSDVYGVEALDAGDLKVTAIEKVGETIVLTVENDSGAPYQVLRTLDLSSGIWDTVATDETGTTWSGPIPAGDRAFWRLTR